MEELDNITLVKTEDLISTLPKYQQNIINQLLKINDAQYLKVADAWLNASAQNIAKFGGEGQSKTFRGAIEVELEKFLCGDKKYKAERSALLKAVAKGNDFIVSAIAVAIASAVGGIAVVIAPVVVLLICNMGKVSVNAWCQMRADTKQA